MPNVTVTNYNGTLFMFNGASGEHQLSGTPAFQFSDDFDVDRIWVDADGNFLSEE